jgi:hypothetical protein
MAISGGCLCGEALLRSYEVPEAERFTHVFCSRCGSTPPFESEVHGLMGIPMCTGNRDQHAALRGAADPTPEAPGRFGAAVEDPIRFEERQVFDLLQARLPRAALTAVAKLRS